METKTTNLPKDVHEIRLLTREQAMGLLGVSMTHLNTLVFRKKNPVPSVKVGKSRRFPLDKLRWWMDNLES